MMTMRLKHVTAIFSMILVFFLFACETPLECETGYIVEGETCVKELEDYTVTFNTNGGNSIAVIMVEEGKSFTEPTAPLKEGYEFLGWFSDSTLNTAYDFSGGVQGDLNLHAKWDIKTIILTMTTTLEELDVATTVELEFGESLELEDLDIAEYNFLGWFEDSDLTIPITTFVAGSEDATIYFKLEEKVDLLQVALITDYGTIDDQQYNQAAYTGMSTFCETRPATCEVYRPTEIGDAAYLNAIELAILEGADVVVLPGWLFETAVYTAQDLYPDTHFIIVDGTPHSADFTDFRIEDNVTSIFFAEHQAGFLAGYAAVKDGYTSLGFTGGMAVPVVVKYGIGYVAGAYYAANELGIDITFGNATYHYFGDFGPSDAHKNLASSWYTSGTEVIFSVAGGAGASVMSAALDHNAKMIGVDIDQSYQSTAVLTSAMKSIDVAVVLSLLEYENGSLASGTNITYDVSKFGVRLPMETSRFTMFSQTDYEEILVDLADGTIVVPMDTYSLTQFLLGLTNTDTTGAPSSDVIDNN